MAAVIGVGTGAHPLTVSTFLGLRDRNPRTQDTTVNGFRTRFDKPIERASKEEAPLFVPAKFIEGAPRKAENVQEVSLAVLDFDDGHAWDDFVSVWKSSGLNFWIYTTYKHTPDAPRWRAVFPLEVPVPGSEWSGVWARISEHLAHGLCDRACKDPGRMYFFPVVPVGGKPMYHSEFHEGKLLSLEDLPEVTPEIIEREEFQREQEGIARTRGRVGDEFDAKASWSEILSGWKYAGRMGTLDKWIRPGKDGKDALSATTGYRTVIGEDRLYCFSSSTALPVGKMLSKFATYSYLECGGDFKEAARRLAKQGYSPIIQDVVHNDAPVDISVTEDELFIATSDRGNALRFARKYQNEVVFVPEQNDWGFWSGKRWVISPSAEARVNILMQECLQELTDEAQLYEDKDTRAALLKHAKASLSNKSIQAAKTLAKSLLTRSIADFDRHPWLLNTQDGTVNLKTGKIKPHDPADYIQQITTCGCAEQYEGAPTFEKYLTRILPPENMNSEDADMARAKFLLSWLGYNLTGSNKEQCFVMLYGEGRNGKSTLIDLINWMLGDYARPMKTEALMASRMGMPSSTAEYELAGLRGRRFVTAEEAGDGERLNESLIKQMTGGDSVNARHPYGRPFTYTPEFKVTLTGNTKPQIRGQDFAIWRRVRLIHFDQTITDAERIEDLNDRLRAESSQILRLLVSKCLQWQVDGLPVPEVIKKDVEAYKEENDYMAVFIEEKCVLNDTNEVSCSDLHQHYLEWAKKTAAPMLNITQFGRSMIARKGIEKGRERSGRKVYKGIAKATEY